MRNDIRQTIIRRIDIFPFLWLEHLTKLIMTDAYLPDWESFFVNFVAAWGSKVARGGGL